MKALILAAGYGTRLQAIAKDVPKPLLAIGGKPLINYSIEKLQGVKDLDAIYVVSNDKFYKNFVAWQKAFENPPCKIQIVNDGSKTSDDRRGSIGDIHFVLREEKVNDDLLVIGGDNLFDDAMAGFLDFAKSKGEFSTIGLFDIHDLQAATKFGVVEINDKKKVVSFEEKPAQPKSTLIGMCLYYFPKAVLASVGRYVQETKSTDRAGDFIRWLSQHQDVYGFKFSGKWYDIGSIESYEEAQMAFSSNKRKDG